VYIILFVCAVYKAGGSERVSKRGVELVSSRGMELQERDYEILRLVHRFRFCLGRHVMVLCGFSGARATDRRLRLLLDAKYLERKKYLYGIPYMYTLSHKVYRIIENPAVYCAHCN